MRSAGVRELAMRLYRAPAGRDDEAEWQLAYWRWFSCLFRRGWAAEEIVEAANGASGRLEAGGDA